MLYGFIQAASESGELETQEMIGDGKFRFPTAWPWVMFISQPLLSCTYSDTAEVLAPPVKILPAI
jgi:hypothetical protein